MDVNTLARCIMSEAAMGNRIEQIAIGFACFRNRNPLPGVVRLAQDILSGRISDPTKGANRWYSPVAMPNQMQH